MSKNVGKVDAIIRVLIGAVFIAYAIQLGFPNTGWNWVGWIGIIPLLTGVFSYCPGYNLLGLSTCGASGDRK